MENVSKALLIAGATLITIILLTLLSAQFSKLKILPNEKIRQYDEQEIVDFNTAFEVYQKNLMYGTDIISALNKALDHNLRNGAVGKNINSFTKAFIDPIMGELMTVEVHMLNPNEVFKDKLTIYTFDKHLLRERSLTEYECMSSSFPHAGKTIEDVLVKRVGLAGGGQKDKILRAGKYEALLGRDMMKKPFKTQESEYDFKGTNFIDKQGVITSGLRQNGSVVDIKTNRDLMAFLTPNKVSIENPLEKLSEESSRDYSWSRLIFEPANEMLKKKIFRCDVSKTEYYKHGRIKKLVFYEVKK